MVSTQPATVAVDAAYYAGGPLGNAPVDWQVTTSSASYAPPGWDEYSFGVWTPWWSNGFDGDSSSEACCFPGIDPSTVETFSATTDASGSNYLQIDFEGADGTLPDLPTTVTAQATVTDVNRQAWTSTTDLLVHPSSLYIGLRSARTFVREGESLDIESIVTGIDGAAASGRTAQVNAARITWGYVDGQWIEQPTDIQSCPITSAAAAVTCTFDASIGGTYRITATVTDDSGATSRSELTRWVSGGDALPTRGVEQQQLTIVPDQQTYAVGDTAELLVQSPFAGEGLAIISRGGIVATRRFAVTGGSAVLEIPITDRDVPNLDVSIEVVGSTERTADDGTALPDAPARPAYAVGSLSLQVSTATRTLTVAAVPRDESLAPGETTQLDVTVTAPDGTPVAGAEFAVVVVDEAVLALTGYQLPDPLAVFYGPVPSTFSARYGRETVILADPALIVPVSASGSDDTAAASESRVGDAAAATTTVAGGNADGFSLDSSTGGGSSTTPIDVRTDFDPLAVYRPSVTTAADGTATIEVPLPDSLTRYRAMVVAVDGAERFGSTTSSITARLPLMVRPSAPRFANFGDTFELPVVVQNQTEAAMTVDVVLQTNNLRLDDPAGKRVEVPANDRVEVRFAVAAELAGTAALRAIAVSGDFADAASVTLPVYTPTTAEAFATYGVLDGGAAIQPLLAPTGVVPQFGGLEVTTSSTALQALTDAVLYLSDYPYRSSDALASRIIAISALRDVLDAFDAAGLPSPAALDAAVVADIAGLVSLQRSDGGFAFWSTSDRSEPYNTIQSTHALLLARAGGFEVPEQTVDGALGYLRDIDGRIPADTSQDVRDVLDAYSLNVRLLAGDRDASAAEALWTERGDALPLDAVAWIWPVIDDATIGEAIARLFDNRAVETAGAANFTTSYSDDAYVLLASDRRTDGLILDALIAQRPGSDLIPKVVAGLLAGQTKGRWDNVQENGFILLALKHYFDTFEAATPEFVARVWLGDRFAGEHSFSGRTADRARIDVPMSELIAAGDAPLTVAEEGSGRLYYRLGLRYAPADLRLDPLDRGFVVQRTYEGVDDPADVSRDSQGIWHVKAGARVRVRLTMVAESQRTHAALIDPLPAGLEILNPSLAVTQPIPTDDSVVIDGGFESSAGGAVDTSWWRTVWFDHQNLRDDRAEAFATFLPAGTYDYSYVARATTPGTFVVPPTRAEEIYAPETFGRAATDTVVVEP